MGTAKGIWAGSKLFYFSGLFQGAQQCEAETNQRTPTPRGNEALNGDGLQLYSVYVPTPDHSWACPKKLRCTHTAGTARLITSAASTTLALLLHVSLPSFILLKHLGIN